ncbi:C2 domain-containing protein [Thecamonas trahens ATCC 50062]|uniref:C2 domain-containing protein n=1 Tax=Thecamonas trahens ATCC 50062 TaxID=461836 RepID=A0A0L0DLG9_THETB|nr:C2 domain-containing protein [Thecamonas trahens ATCC 50062]KNC53147.1 C2 domain-containing protein [Thecamonas trahens ATCC 50062]|eukprot:XP_013754620.1 C2 domain-containing protein [Thecamonas trahens ATCC 50062]
MAATHEETASAAGANGLAAEHATTDPDHDSDSDAADGATRKLTGRVVVHVYEARRVMDGEKERSLFVKIKYRGKKETTETANKSREPRFDYHAAFQLKDDDKDDVFTFEVIADKTLGNSTLGIVEYNLSQLDDDAVSTGAIWLPLVSRPGKDDPACGELRIKIALSMLRMTLVEARGLKAVSSNSASPYGFLRYDGKKYRTPVVKKSLSPTWEGAQMLAEATWKLPFVLGTHFAKLEMWSKGMLSSTFLGQARIRVAAYDVPDGAPPVDVWIPLLPRQADEEVSGEVRLRLESLEPPEDLAHTSREVPVDNALNHGTTLAATVDALPESERAKAMVGEQVEVEVLRLENVSDSAKVDPYVIVRYDDERFTTQVAPRQTSPAFNERHTFTLGKLSKKFPEHAVIGDVWDQHKISDTFLGRFKLAFDQLPMDGRWLELNGFELRGRRERLASGHDPDEVQGAAWIRARRAAIMVDILRASDLAAKDRNGASDPFVVASYGEDQSFRTAVVPKSLNPVWNTPLAFRYEIGHEILRFDVWDKDTLSNDYLGHVELRVGDFTDGRPHKAWYKLVRRDIDELVSGEICLQVQCTAVPTHAFDVGAVRI